MATLPALQRRPCLVAFSGGRDSSLVLAAACSAARRWGLPPPVPVTLCFRSEASDEEPWQANVLRHLHIDDWQRLSLTHELDFLGAIAQGRLSTWGLRYPTNAHSMVPAMQEAQGGALLTGLGGDDVLGSWRWAAPSTLLPRRRAGAVSPTAVRAVRTFPPAVRRALLTERVRRQMSRQKRGYSWLTPKGRDVAVAALVDADDQPTAWAAFVAWAARRRHIRVTEQTMIELAARYDVAMPAPLLDRGFLSALAAAGHRRGFADRTAATGAVAAGHLPPELVSRRDKGLFHEVFWGPNARSYAQSWQGGGVDPSLVDPEALRSEWSSPCPDFRSTLLLHHCWLATHGVEGPRS